MTGEDGGRGNLREELCEVGRYRRAGRAHEHGLVILAMGIPYWLMPLEEGGYGLFVERGNEVAVCEQLGRYDRENRYWPPPEDFLPGESGAGRSLLLYLLLIWGMFLGGTRELLEAGSASEEAIRAGEWWRAVTALTLHADWAHLVGNTAGAFLFFFLVFRFLGHGFGWFTILLAGASGNLLNAWIYSGTGHNSIGASTAVFGGLGIVIGFRLIRQARLTGWKWPRQLLAPLVAGIVLLGLLGAGGERTDILAHVWGFVCGVGIGALSGMMRLDTRVKGVRAQRVYGVVTIGIVIGAWMIAVG